MSESFINENFLLNNKKSQFLYHTYAENQPIIDYHCHLSPEMISDDHRFENLTRAWLGGDHYKWRAMRINGIDERYCTGNASDREKFKKWAETVPSTIGNPLYHWTHLELARYFNIYDLLSPLTCDDIYEKASSMLQSEISGVRSLLKRMNVEIVCTTDDPVDNLEYHKKLSDSSEIRVLPTFRPDNILKTDDIASYLTYIRKLEEASGIGIKNFDTLLEALDKRHKYFHEIGCRLSDHGLERFYFSFASSCEVNSMVHKLLNNIKLSVEETEMYRTSVLLELCKMNYKRGWVQQFHSGAIRNNNSRMFSQMGPDTGWDSIGNTLDISKTSKFLNELDKDNQLARTILYNLNPADNEMLITMAANFNDGSVPAKVQCGAAWWFLDQKHGIEKNLSDIASFGLLRRFAGMVTDSRSFLSYPRHEYFRRILCNFICDEVEMGLIPDDETLLKPLIEGISYFNAKEFFRF